MSYLVFIDTRSGGQKHSLWTSREECSHQVDVLREHGYSAWWEFIPARADVPNGHYFL
jgi:hypothetical protein